MNHNDYTVRGSDDPAAIEREIEGTRSRMTRDLDALGRKLSPRNLAAEAGNAITDRARDTGHGLLSMVRENPWPAAAVGASVAWLVVQARSGQHSTSRWPGVRSYEGPSRRFGDVQDAADYDDEPSRIDAAKDTASRMASNVADKAHALTDSASHAVDVAKDRATDLATTAKAKAADLTTTAKARASDLAATAKERTRRLGTTIQDESRQVRDTLQQQTHEHPLMVAAGAAVLGLVLGMVIPATSKENKVMGPARDRLADRVEETASRVKDVATDEARKVADSVKDEVRQHTPELKNAARDVAESVKEDVKQSAGRVKDEAKAAATGSQPGINPS
jgi:ElaB/YqjD/DUF883 family membrane-anchored ribosome-binding protein